MFGKSLPDFLSDGSAKGLHHRLITHVQRLVLIQRLGFVVTLPECHGSTVARNGARESR